MCSVPELINIAGPARVSPAAKLDVCVGGLASEILVADANLEENTKRLLKEFLNDFEQAGRDGTLPAESGLYQVSAAIAMWAWADTQELEGVNSLVKIACSRSPNMSLPLDKPRPLNRWTTKRGGII